MTKKEKSIFYLFIAIYAITLAYAVYINITLGYQVRLSMCVMAVISPILLPIFFKLMKWKITFEIGMINIIFCYFAALWGSCLGGYSTAYFDKVVHFVFGFIGISLAYLIYCLIKHTSKIIDKSEFTLFLVFINATNLAIAALWEFYEYALLVFFNNDAVNHYTTGVHDSMLDMIVCALGGLIVTYFLYRAYKNKKSSVYERLVEKFYTANFQ